ncbi:MAG: tetratricopeptide repeat protein [Luteitalea sp.]|nr:tetratricopeptide repeat protein [Luteitalea sp.]
MIIRLASVMSHRCCRALAVVLLAGSIAADSGEPAERFAASQASTGEETIDERLGRLEAMLFAGTDGADNAIPELKKILSLDPRSAEAHFLLGIAYGRMGSPELVGEAKAELRQALALKPDLVQARFYLGEVYLKLGRAERTRDELEAALLQVPGHPQFLALLGEAERQLGNPDRSQALNRQALQVAQSFVQARYYLGLALLDLGQREQAIHELQQVVESDSRVPEVYLSLGSAYLDAGRPEAALEVLRDGAQIDPSRPDIRIKLARAYRSNGLLDEAEEQLALTLPEGTPMLASTYYQQLESDLYLELGLVKLQRGQVKAAADAFEKALQIDPNQGLTHRHLAEAYLLQGSYPLASEHAARAEKLGFPLAEDERKSLEEGLRRKGRRE